MSQAAIKKMVEELNALKEEVADLTGQLEEQGAFYAKKLDESDDRLKAKEAEQEQLIKDSMAARLAENEATHKLEVEKLEQRMSKWRVQAANDCWYQALDEESRQVYWENIDTGEVVWAEPPKPPKPVDPKITVLEAQVKALQTETADQRKNLGDYDDKLKKLYVTENQARTDINGVRTELRDLKMTTRQQLEEAEAVRKENKKEIKRLVKLSEQRLMEIERLNMQWEEVAARFFLDTEYRNAVQADLEYKLATTQAWYDQTVYERDSSRAAHAAESDHLTKLLDEAYELRDLAIKRQKRAEDDLAFELSHLGLLWPVTCQGNHVMPTVLRDNLPKEEAAEMADIEAPALTADGLAAPHDPSMQFLILSGPGLAGVSSAEPGHLADGSPAAAIGRKDYTSDSDGEEGERSGLARAYAAPESDEDLTMFSVASKDEIDGLVDIPSMARLPEVLSGSETEAWSASDATSVSGGDDDAPVPSGTVDADALGGSDEIFIPEDMHDLDRDEKHQPPARRAATAEEVEWHCKWREIHLAGTAMRMRVRRQHRDDSSMLHERRTKLANSLRFHQKQLRVVEEEISLLENDSATDLGVLKVPDGVSDDGYAAAQKAQLDEFAARQAKEIEFMRSRRNFRRQVMSLLLAELELVKSELVAETTRRQFFKGAVEEIKEERRRLTAAVRDCCAARQELRRHAMSLEDRWAKAITWPDSAPNEMESVRIKVLVERELARLTKKLDWVAAAEERIAERWGSLSAERDAVVRRADARVEAFYSANEARTAWLTLAFRTFDMRRDRLADVQDMRELIEDDPSERTVLQQRALGVGLAYHKGLLDAMVARLPPDPGSPPKAPARPDPLPVLEVELKTEEEKAARAEQERLLAEQLQAFSIAMEEHKRELAVYGEALQALQKATKALEPFEFNYNRAKRWLSGLKLSSRSEQEAVALKSSLTERAVALDIERRASEEMQAMWYTVARKDTTQLESDTASGSESTKLLATILTQASRWRLATARAAASEVAARAKHQIKQLERDRSEREREIELMVEELSHKRYMYEYEIHGFEDKSTETLEFLKREIERQLRILAETVAEYEAKIVKLREEYEAQLTQLRLDLADMTEKATLRLNWVHTLQLEKQIMKDRFEEFETKTRLEKERQAEKLQRITGDLAAKTVESENRMRWIDSLKTDVELMRVRLEAYRAEMADLQRVWGEERRQLQYQLWRRDETARHIRTNVDSAFLWFAEILHCLAGARKVYNVQLTDNRAVEVLTALANSPRQVIRALAGKALGRLGWDGSIEASTISYVANDDWKKWVERSAEALEAELKASGSRWDEGLHDVAEDKIAAQVASSRALAGSTVRRRYALDRAADVNNPNQARVGTNAGSLDALVGMCQEDALTSKESASDALAILALAEGNKKRLGNNLECLRTLVTLCDSSDVGHETVRRNSAAALSNLAHKHEANAERIAELDGVDVLVRLVTRCTDPDTLENVTGALANLMSSSVKNGRRLGLAGGIEALLDLLASPRSTENDLIAVNAAETLANATRFEGADNSARIRMHGVMPLILLCASDVVDLRRHAALALGNVAQSDENRRAVGEKGGVEALFLLAEIDDEISKANACWALSNLAWNPENQERIADHLPQLFTLLRSLEMPVREHASSLLANSLYFHEGNRRRVGRYPDGIPTVVRLCDTPWPKVQAQIARALGTLAYSEVNCRMIGLAGGVEALIRCCDVKDKDVQRYAAFALGNLAVHDGNKPVIRTEGGIEALVRLNASEDAEIVEAANQALAVMANMSNQADLAKMKNGFGVSGLVDLMHADNPLVQGLAAEALAEEVWNDVKKQSDIGAAKGGIEGMVKMLRLDDPSAVTRALWAMRNATYKHRGNKDAVGKVGGIRALLRLADMSNPAEQVECALACLINVALDHETNSRLIMSTGLDTLITLAEAPAEAKRRALETASAASTKRLASRSSDRDMRDEDETPAWLASPETVATVTSNSALALDLLHIIGPYNYILCTNCGSREAGGERCSQCGHRIHFEAVTKA